MRLTRPVSIAYRRRAAVTFVLDAPGKLAVVNRLSAGSPDTTSKSIDGSIAELRAQSVYWVHEPPRLMLCDPLSHVRVSSRRNDVALRACGEGPALGPVTAEPIVGKLIWNPR